MTIHVDPMMACIANKRWPYPRACHMFADTIPELHDKAAQIGLKHAWFQNQPGHVPHYDLTDGKRGQAVAAGAVELTASESVAFWYAKGWRGKRRIFPTAACPEASRCDK